MFQLSDRIISIKPNGRQTAEIEHFLSLISMSDKRQSFYPRDAMLARVIAIATCPSVRLSRAGIVSKRRKLAS